MSKPIIFIYSLVFSINVAISQNQLPLSNGILEDTDESGFLDWSHQANEGGEATFSIVTNGLVEGS